MGKNRRQDKTETLRERLQEEQTRLLFEIDKAASTIEGMSAGKIYSAYGAKVVQRLDALTQAEEKLSEAILYLGQVIEPEREQCEAN